ncbi:protein-L-isoaspartate(D-aspartate) O-methyltransferase [Fodinibius sp. Rm-B-1B1-1]|uniref:protein-L-isoaspartate(D-aspartate) O-methyltransferase n=1 Tax=Fodinibius alkaliphilus TaxID=3140241 RepID=UPI00315AF6CE
MKKLNYLLVLLITGAGLWLTLDKPAPLPPDQLTPPSSVDTVLTDTLHWNHPRFDQRKEERHQMVEDDIISRGITDSSIIAAMKHVPRHFFVPKNHQNLAYSDRPLPIGHDQTISQPYIVAYMTKSLEVEPGEKVLEIGTGSGYQAAVLSELTPHVYTIEIVKPLGDQAIRRFKILGYHTIQTKIGNGYTGWPKYAPFDKIILTAAPQEIPQPLIDQLAPGGIMIAPIGSVDSNQILTKITKDEKGNLSRQKMLPVRFVPMTGKSQKQ